MPRPAACRGRIVFVALSALTALSALLWASGCKRRIEGPRSWWDDRAGRSLPADYRLPPEEDVRNTDTWGDIAR